MPKKMYLSDIGTVIRVTLKDENTELPLPLATATTIQFVFTAPDGTEIIKTGVVEDEDSGIVTYTVLEDDFTQTGRYTYHVYVVITGWSGRSNDAHFTIFP